VAAVEIVELLIKKYYAENQRSNDINILSGEQTSIKSLWYNDGLLLE